MRCAAHEDTEAMAICMHCGKGICAQCARTSESGRAVCSIKCGTNLASFEKAIALIHSKAQRHNRVTSVMYYVMGTVFLLFTAIPLLDGLWQLAVLTSAIGVAMIIAGTWYGRIAKVETSAAP
jgi:VIT1/CCC1 family predicted Fe2+/Mn2+ transporter